MSTRRTTRATSIAAASNAAESEFSTVVGAPKTPRRVATRRAGQPPTPAAAGSNLLQHVSLTTSTAYGSSSVAPPGAVSGQEDGDQIENVLFKLLDQPTGGPKRKGDNESNVSRASTTGTARTGRRGRRGSLTPGPIEDTFNNESGVYRGAGMESSPPLSDLDPLDPLIEYSEDELLEDEPTPRPKPVPKKKPAPKRKPGPKKKPPPTQQDQEIQAPLDEATSRPGSVQSNQPPLNEPPSRLNSAQRSQPPEEQAILGPDSAQQKVRAEQEAYDNLARERLQEAREADAQAKPPSPIAERARDSVKRLSSTANKLFTWCTQSVFHAMLATVLASLLILFVSSRLASADGFLSRLSPQNIFSPEDVASINGRIFKLEQKVDKILKASSSNKDAINRIAKMIPDTLVLKKNSRGEIQIPRDFYSALLSKLENEDKNKSSTGQPSKEIQTLVRKEIEDHWAKFIKSNEAKSKYISQEDFDKRFPQMLKHHFQIQKPEILDLLRAQLDENNQKIKSSLVNEYQLNTRNLNDKDIKMLFTTYLEEAIPKAQLKSLAKAKLMGGVLGDDRVNHFNPLAGAVIVPYWTTTTYTFPSYDVWFPVRLMRMAMSNPVPVPNQPHEALRRWDEHGECWCADALDDQGSSSIVTLGVIIASEIYPDQIVVEHVGKNASLQPGAAPKEMDLLAYVPDIDIYKAAKELSDITLGETEEALPPHFIRIASWTYDLESDTSQSFDIGVDMQGLRAHTSRFIVRARNNWGENIPYTCLYRIKVFGDIAKEKP